MTLLRGNERESKRSGSYRQGSTIYVAHAADVLSTHTRYFHSFSLGGHKLADLGPIRVLFAAILTLGVVIICKRSSNIVPEFNGDDTPRLERESDLPSR
jgi:hypothetical protein